MTSICNDPPIVGASCTMAKKKLDGLKQFNNEMKIFLFNNKMKPFKTKSNLRILNFMYFLKIRNFQYFME